MPKGRDEQGKYADRCPHTYEMPLYMKREPGVGFVAGSDTSEEAAHSMKDKARRARAKVFARIRQMREFGGTRDEVEVALGMAMQTVSPRFVELEAQGAIRKNGQKRRTRQGRLANVYVAVEYLPAEES